MRNKVHYIKPTNYGFPEAIKDGLIKALSIAKEKDISNIKLVLTEIGLLDNPPNYISQALDKIFEGQGENLTKKLKKDRGFSIPNFPKTGTNTGVNTLLLNNNPTFIEEDTVVILIWSDYDSFKKMESILFWTEIDLVAIIFNERDELNELLSATKGINISNTPDQNVIPYINNFPSNVNDILSRLKSINITDSASHTPTRERMKDVIKELSQNQIKIFYKDFLGFLLNDVNFKLEDSVELLNWQHKYFGR